MNKILFKQVEGKGKFFLNGDLVNGEIVNPEALELIERKDKIMILKRTGPFEYAELKDGDTFDLFEGMGFEEREWVVGAKFIRLLPEKPVQEEESQVELWKEVYQIIQDYNGDRNGKGWFHYVEHKFQKRFTIKRKES